MKYMLNEAFISHLVNYIISCWVCGRLQGALKSVTELRNVRRILVKGVNAPLPPEAKKMLKI